MQKEAAIKAQEKALELQKPSLLALETQIAHAERKIAKAKSTSTTVEKEVEEQEAELARLQNDLESFKQVAAAAEGAKPSLLTLLPF